MSEHRQIDSFERNEVNAVGTGEDTVAVAAGRDVAMIAPHGRSEFEHQRPVIDVAVGTRGIVLSEQTVTAYTLRGEKLWTSRQSGQRHAVAVHPEEDVVGVLSREKLRLLDMGSGEEQAVIERPRSGQPENDILLGTEQGFVLGTWSFLSRISIDDGVELDRNINAAIRDLGVCNNVLIIALESDRTLGLDLGSGRVEWQTELEVKQVSPVSHDQLPVRTADGIRTLADDGTIDALSDIPDGEVYASVQRSVLCSVRNGTVSAFVPQQEMPDVEVTTDTVGIGGTIDVEITNNASDPQTLNLEAALENGSLSPNSRSIKVDQESTTVVDFPVEEVSTEGRSDLTIETDQMTVANETVRLKDAAGSKFGADVNITPVAVEENIVQLEVTVENDGQTGLDAVGLIETDETVAVGPGETWTETVGRPYDPGRNVSVGIQIERGSRTERFAPTCTLPEPPAIEATTETNATKVTVDAPDNVTFTDQLMIDVPGAGRVRSDVEIDDQMTLIIPTFEDGVIQIRFTNVDVEEQVRTNESGLTSNTFGRSQQPTRDPQQADQFGQRQERHQEHTGTSHETRQSDTQQGPQQTTSTGQETGSQALREQATQQSTSTSSADQTQRSTEVEIQRELSIDQPWIGEVVAEEITVQNTGETVVDPTIHIGTTEQQLSTIQPDEQTSITRDIALLADEGQVTVPEIEVRNNGSVIGTAEKASYQPATDDIQLQIAFDETDKQLIGTIKNEGSVPYNIAEIYFDGQQVSIDPMTARPGDTLDINAEAWHSPTTSDAHTGKVVIERNEKRVPVDIAIPVIEDDASNENLLGLDIGEQTEAAGKFGTVVLVAENTDTRELSNVEITAKGKPINDHLYSGVQREQLAAGERIEHYIDLKADPGTASFTVTIEYAADESEREHTVSVSGPVRAEKTDWTDSDYQQWTIERNESSQGQQIAMPDIVAL